MKVKVKSSFVDKDTKVNHKPGEELDIPVFRAGELYGKGIILLPEVISEESAPIELTEESVSEWLKADPERLEGIKKSLLAEFGEELKDSIRPEVENSIREELTSLIRQELEVELQKQSADPVRAEEVTEPTETEKAEKAPAKEKSEHKPAKEKAEK